MIEAMAAGKPIVGATTGAVPEVLGGVGLLAEPLQPQLSLRRSGRYRCEILN